MDSNPLPNTDPNPTLSQASARKLPIKRKTHNPNPNLHPDSNLTPKPEPSTTAAFADADDEYGDGDASDDDGVGDRKLPPFKFHRIWTESDELRFLQGLVDCSGEGLSFPRDLAVFYGRFSGAMSQPFSKSQLSEKLRRLRKKFRVASARLARGVEFALLSPHDRALFELSKKLWHPDFSSVSPFGNSGSNGANKKCKQSNSDNLVGVKVSFSPTLPIPSNACLNDHNIMHCVDNEEFNDGVGAAAADDDNYVDVNVGEMNFDANIGGLEEELCGAGSRGSDFRRVAAKTVLDVFDQSLKDVRMVLIRQGLLYPDHKTDSSRYPKDGRAVDFEKRWREQQVAELDVLARRLRLVLENALHGH